jgi:hypothetical protein
MSNPVRSTCGSSTPASFSAPSGSPRFEPLPRGSASAQPGAALAMAVDPAVLAPVLSQPGLPAPLTAAKRAAVGLDATDLAQVKARTRGGLCVLGLRFSADRGCPAERSATLRHELGGAFEAIEIDSSPSNPHGIPTRAHAVLTVDVVDQPGHPTWAALDRVLGFLDQRLHP